MRAPGIQWQNYNYGTAGGYYGQQGYPAAAAAPASAAGYDAAAYAHYPYGHQAAYAYPVPQAPAELPLHADNGDAAYPPLPPGTAPPDASTAGGAGAGAAAQYGYAYPQQHYYPPAPGYGQQYGGGYGQQQQYAPAAPAPHAYVPAFGFCPPLVGEGDWLPPAALLDSQPASASHRCSILPVSLCLQVCVSGVQKPGVNFVAPAPVGSGQQRRRGPASVEKGSSSSGPASFVKWFV